MRFRRNRDRAVKTTPTTSYTEIKAHRDGRVAGYIPDSVFDEIVRRTEPVTWIDREQSARLRAHPSFIPAPVGCDSETPTGDAGGSR